MTPHLKPTTASRLTRATLLLAVGGTLFFLALPGMAQPPADPGGDAVITVDFADDDMGFNVTSSKDISNIWVVLCDDSQHKHDDLDGLFFNHTEDQEIVGVYVKSGDNGIEGNDPPGAGEYFANEGVDCGETSTSGSDTDTETSGSDTDTETSGSETQTETGNEDNVTLCHATGSESNPYEVITTDAAGAYDGHLGSDHQDGEDIIPPFMFDGTEYSQNWDAAGQAIFENDCEPVDGSDTDTETSGSDTDTETSGSDTGTETEEIPVFGTATTLALGVGGALGGALLMLRRRL